MKNLKELILESFDSNYVSSSYNYNVVNEAFASSILQRLYTANDNKSKYNSKFADFLQSRNFGGKIRLSEIQDEDIVVIDNADIKKAYKFGDDARVFVIYVDKNDKIMAITTGGKNYVDDYGNVQGKRTKDNRFTTYNDADPVTGRPGDERRFNDIIRDCKCAYVFDMEVLMAAIARGPVKDARESAREGATAMMKPDKFLKIQQERYRDLLALRIKDNINDEVGDAISILAKSISDSAKLGISVHNDPLVQINGIEFATFENVNYAMKYLIDALGKYLSNKIKLDKYEELRRYNRSWENEQNTELLRDMRELVTAIKNGSLNVKFTRFCQSYKSANDYEQAYWS